MMLSNSVKGGNRPLAGRKVWTVILLASLLSALRSNGEEPDPFALTNSWFVTIRCHSYSSPAIGEDGTVYLGAWDGKLRAITPRGLLSWDFATDLEIQSSPAIAADGTIYIGSRDRYVYAVSPAGRKKWKFKTGGWVDASPGIASDGTVYIGSWDKKLYALNPDGSLKWAFPTRGEIVSSAAIGADDAIYFGSHDKKFYALRPDGTIKWEFLTGGPIICSPTVKRSECLYFSSVDGFLYAFNLDGSERWRLKTGGVSQSSPSLGPEGNIYIGVNDCLWGISSDGKKLWQRAGELFLDASPLLFADSSLCFVSRGGHCIGLYPLDPNLKLKWRHYLFGQSMASPTVSPDGTIYMPSHEARGAVCAMSNGQPLAKTPWPKFRGNLRNTGNVKDIP